MGIRSDTLVANLRAALGDAVKAITVAPEEITAVVGHDRMIETLVLLRDRSDLRFEMLIDATGLDYSSYGNAATEGPRFAVVYHLLSLANNWRLRVRVYAPADDFPVLPSIIGIWPAANWYEREIFDLFGIVFTGHPDLRRILTDYGFIGYPFRKDFPLSGHVEMRYDPEQRRIIYQPVTIEPRVITPRIVREQNYADAEPDRRG